MLVYVLGGPLWLQYRESMGRGVSRLRRKTSLKRTIVITLGEKCSGPFSGGGSREGQK